MNTAQHTLKRPIRATGIGLHTGGDVVLTLSPAPVDTGIVFHRSDLRHAIELPARIGNVVDTTLATTLGINGTRVGTVEHLMAAFSGLGIDNAHVTVNAGELPIMDGSAAPFVYLIQKAGIRPQAARRKYLRVLKTVSVRDVDQDGGDVFASLAPHDGFRVEYTMDYDHPAFVEHNGQMSVDVSRESFGDLSHARTFGFLADIERLWDMDLARGGSLANAVVIDDDGILNSEGLRMEREFALHKILDVIGDLYTIGYPIMGVFRGHRSGHATNSRLARALLADPSAYEIVTGPGIGHTENGTGTGSP